MKKLLGLLLFVFVLGVVGCEEDSCGCPLSNSPVFEEISPESAEYSLREMLEKETMSNLFVRGNTRAGYHKHSLQIERGNIERLLSDSFEFQTYDYDDPFKEIKPSTKNGLNCYGWQARRDEILPNYEDNYEYYEFVSYAYYDRYSNGEIIYMCIGGRNNHNNSAWDSAGDMPIWDSQVVYSYATKAVSVGVSKDQCGVNSQRFTFIISETLLVKK